MTRTLHRVRVIAAGTTAAVRTVARRLVRGPSRASWTWSEELFVGVSRATATASARDVALMAPPRRGLRPPIRRAVRVAITVESVDLRGVRAERYCPRATPSGTIVWFHGGGFVSGSVNLERRVAAARAALSNCDTYNIDYRLAPTHPFPAALDDAVTAYRALVDNGADPTTTILHGGSAGACLALASLLKIRDLGLAQPAGAVLLWPYADFTFSGATIHTNAEIDMLPLRDLAAVFGPAYVGDADPGDPLVSPALADLTGLPPLLVIAGGAESLLSCAEQIDANARRDGVDVQLTVYPDKVHGWMILPKLPATTDAVDEITTWISRRIGPPDPN